MIVRLKEAGAIIIGKTNLHEFAFGTTSEETAFGPVTNPFDVSRSAGGSSGGAAAALATGMCFGALGTDTGGSIRIPSAACGTVGLKATDGELSCEGVVPLSTSLDHVGPMAGAVADVAILFDALAGRPPVGTPAAVRATSLVFGVPRTYFCDKFEPGTRKRSRMPCAALRAAGHTVRDVEIAHAAWTADVYLHIVLPEASQYHAQLLDRYACPLFTGRAHPAGDGPLLARGRLRARATTPRAPQARRRSRARGLRCAAPPDAADSGAEARGDDSRDQRHGGARSRHDAPADAAVQHHGPSGYRASGGAERRSAATKRADRRPAPRNSPTL